MCNVHPMDILQQLYSSLTRPCFICKIYQRCLNIFSISLREELHIFPMLETPLPLSTQFNFRNLGHKEIVND